MPDLAQRVSRLLGLTYVSALEKIHETDPQKTRENSEQQARNVRDAFAVHGAVPSGAVLLIDDVVDSRWTFTECARVLRAGGRRGGVSDGACAGWPIMEGRGLTAVATSDSQAITLLCAPIAIGAAKPLTPSEWAKLAAAIHGSELGRPGALMVLSASELADQLCVSRDSADRVASLLERGGTLAFELERLESRGVWIVARSDDSYPESLKRRLGLRAPAVLFGAGRREVVPDRGIAVVWLAGRERGGTRVRGRAWPEYCGEWRDGRLGCGARHRSGTRWMRQSRRARHGGRCGRRQPRPSDAAAGRARVPRRGAADARLAVRAGGTVHRRERDG